jgi:hypothetical protein
MEGGKEATFITSFNYIGMSCWEASNVWLFPQAWIELCISQKLGFMYMDDKLKWVHIKLTTSYITIILTCILHGTKLYFNQMKSWCISMKWTPCNCGLLCSYWDLSIAPKGWGTWTQSKHKQPCQCVFMLIFEAPPRLCAFLWVLAIH